MHVLLQRNLFLGGQRYRRNRFGTEIPDEIDGRKIVLFDPARRDDDTVLMLPQDAVAFTSPDELKSNDLISNAAATRPTALSEMTEKTKGEREAQERASHSQALSKLGKK